MRHFIPALTMLTALIAGSAYAGSSHYADRDGLFFAPYVGGGYEYTHSRHEDAGVEDNFNGLEAHAGLRLHKNFGLEVGYGGTETGDGNISGNTSKGEFRTINLDVMGYVPVADGLELVGSVGASHVRAHLDVATLGSASSSDWNPRIGAGAQYWLSQDISARGMLHYTDADDGGLVSPSIGLDYHF